MPVVRDDNAAAHLPTKLHEHNVQGMNMFIFCNEEIYRINLANAQKYVDLAGKYERAMINKKTVRADADIVKAWTLATYHACWRCIMIWFVGMAHEHDRMLPLLIGDITQRILLHLEQTLGDGMPLPAAKALKTRITQFKKTLGVEMGEIGYDYDAVFEDAMQRSVPVLCLWF
mgnify:CR=1 FL=1|tara:strand:+ start:1475 stop:1993 length:519 start_codon:yes stop_codon:yes gene_type:complete